MVFGRFKIGECIVLNVLNLLKKTAFAPMIFSRFYVSKALINVKYKNDLSRRSRAEWMSFQSFRNDLIHKLRKKYKKEIVSYKKEIDKNDAILPHNHNKTIWVCWLQGLENAPDLVKMCVQSLRKNLCGGEYNLVLLTEDNYAQYASFSDHIMIRYKQGIISKALFSDLLRLHLLTTYGGTWIDATVFCTNSEIPKYMLESDLFVFTMTELEKCVWASPFESYYLSASQNNKILLLTYSLLKHYCKSCNSIIDYFILYDFFAIAIEEYPEIWSNVVSYPRADTMVLAGGMFKKYDKEMYCELISHSPFHKLSYKAKYTEGSVLDHLIKHYGDIAKDEKNQ